MMRVIVIHGAMRTGKTLNAEAFRAHYQCQRVQDWHAFRRRGYSEFPVSDGDLLLTTEPPAVIQKLLPTATLVPVNTARQAIGLEPAPAIGFR